MQKCVGIHLFFTTSPSSIVKDFICEIFYQARVQQRSHRSQWTLVVMDWAILGPVLWLAWKPSSPPQLPWSVEGFIPVWALSRACQTSPFSRWAALSHVLTHLEEEGTAIASLLYLLELGHYGKVQIFLVGLLVVFSMSSISCFPHRARIYFHSDRLTFKLWADPSYEL